MGWDRERLKLLCEFYAEIECLAGFEIGGKEIFRY